MVNIYIYISSTSPQGCNKVLLTLWRHDGAIVSVTNLLITLNDALTHSAVLVQVHDNHNELVM